LQDAEVQKVSVNYQERKLTLYLSVWVGGMEDPPERREAYRVARADDVLVRSLWVSEWNAFIHIAAKQAEILWQGDIVYRPRREHFRPSETLDLT
jgi:hypothetical protein